MQLPNGSMITKQMKVDFFKMTVLLQQGTVLERHKSPRPCDYELLSWYKQQGVVPPWCLFMEKLQQTFKEK